MRYFVTGGINNYTLEYGSIVYKYNKTVSNIICLWLQQAHGNCRLETPIQNGNEIIFVCLEGQYLPNMHKKVLYIKEQFIVYS